jgi:hypothetical protein
MTRVPAIHRFARLWWLPAIPAGVLLLAFTPVGKPADDVQTLHVTAGYNLSQRGFIRSKATRRGLPHKPQSVTFQTDGAPVRVYLLDLSGIADSRARVYAMLRATAEIEQRREPGAAPVVVSAVDVTEGRFDLHRWPWGRAEYTLVVAGEQTAEITFRVSYGR